MTNTARSLGGRLIPRTMRMRLTAGLVLLVLAACIVVGIVTSLSLHGFLLTRLDQQLNGAGGRFASSIDGNDQAGSGGAGSSGAGGSPSSIPGQAVGTLGVQLSNGKITQGQLVQNDGSSKAITFSAADAATLATVPATRSPRTVHLSALGDYRVEAMTAPGTSGQLQLSGLPLSTVNDTVDRLLLIEAAVFAAVLLASGLAATAVVRLTLRPLRQLTSTALHVSELPLSSGTVALPARESITEPGTEVGQVGAAFNHMLEHVETALTARHETEDRLRRFVADASHELRTPVATIRSYSELAQRGPETLPPQVDRALGRIESEAIRMGVLVDDLLLLARLDAGRPLDRDPVELTLLAIDSVNDARAAAPDHQWRLDLDDEPIDTVGDGHRLRQVLANLLANAGMHTPPGTTVTLHLRRRADRLEIVVSDDGPGIPAELQPRLFERFARAEISRTRSAGGTGLGLAIAHGIVHAHGGSLTVLSEAGDTRFTIVLPDPGDNRTEIEVTPAEADEA
jgi:two-component system OmpR family sensor kinase